MELVEVIAIAHFEDSRIGALSRKQRTKIPLPVAEQLVDMGLVAYVNPPVAVAQENPLTDPQQDGVEQLSESSQAEQVSPKQTRKYTRRNKEQTDGE
jgi:hypothetical protein